MHRATMRGKQQHRQFGLQVTNSIAQAEALGVSLRICKDHAIDVHPREYSQSMLGRNCRNHVATGLFQDAMNMLESLSMIDE
jgi:hypothetical protein